MRERACVVMPVALERVSRNPFFALMDLGLAGIPKELPRAVQQLLQECFDHNSNLRPSFAEIRSVFDQEWKIENAPLADAALLVEPQSTMCRGADAYCLKTLVEEKAGDTQGEHIPASQLVNQVFRNALREVKDRKCGSDGSQQVPTRTKVGTCASGGEVVRLQTYDKHMLEMPYGVAKRSCTLCWQLQLQEQAGGTGGTDSFITLNDPSCTLSMISKVGVYLQTLQDAERGLKDTAELRKVETVLTDVDEEGVFALLMVANYLDLPELTYLACNALKPQVQADAALASRSSPPPFERLSASGREAIPQQLPVCVWTESRAAGTDDATDIDDATDTSATTSVLPETTQQVEMHEGPELPSRTHRFDRATRGGATRSHSSPAKPQALALGVQMTGQLLSEADMKKLLAQTQGSPAKTTFLPAVGMLESLTDWGKSSWTDLVQPRVAHAAVPASPTHQNSPARVKRTRATTDENAHHQDVRHDGGEGPQPVPLPPNKKRMGHLAANTLDRDHHVPAHTAATSVSIHCTPFVKGAKNLSSSDPLALHSQEQGAGRDSQKSSRQCDGHHTLQHTATHCNTLQHTATHRFSKVIAIAR